MSSLLKQRLSNLRLVITLNKTLMKHIQKDQKSKRKSIPAYGSQEKNRRTKSLETFAKRL
jgi:hypothetical protein